MTRRESMQHLDALRRALDGIPPSLALLDAWGAHLARVLTSDGRLLVAGNGGSAAQAQHLTAELVGRYRDERPPMSALALHAETSSVTAIVNDYGADELFARQVTAHGRADDVFLALSTSGASRNLVRAAAAARERGLAVWACTGRAPNPLAGLADAVVAIDASDTATVQEVHLVVVHLLCEAVDRALASTTSGSTAPTTATTPSEVGA